MSANRDFVFPLQAIGTEAPFGLELSDKQTVVRHTRILLVDDEEPLRACVRMMLELDGHQVTEAANGAEALTLLSLGEFDLVITDYEMPEMKGNELAVSLRSLDPFLPILMLTASLKVRVDAGNPVDALLNKPVTVPELRGALGQLWSARPCSTEPKGVLA